MGRLFWKIFIAFWLTLLAITVAVGGAIHLYNQARLAELTELAAGPRAEFAVNATAAALRHGGEDAVESLFEDWPGRRPPPVLIVEADGEELFHRPVPRDAYERALAQLADNARAPGLRRVVAPDGDVYVLFVPAEVLGHRAERRASEAETFWLRVAIAFVASLLFSAGLAFYITRPVRHLQSAAHRLAGGRLDTRVMPAIGRRRDEIADLGRDFDHMAEQLEALVGAQRRLLHDVSHELRSPLARLQVAIALARQQPEKLEALLDRIEREGERLNELVGELLTLARLEAGVSREPMARFALGELLETVAGDARFEAEASGRGLKLVLEQEVELEGRVELLRRAFENVMRNAVRHTADGTRVEVHAALDADQRTYRVSVCDRGPGLPPAELGRIFEPFVRGTGELTGGLAGYGLGLAIARRAIESHGGHIVARNRADGGLCIDIDLPLEAGSEKGRGAK